MNMQRKYRIKSKEKSKETKEPITKKKVIVATFLIFFAFFGSFLFYFLLSIALNTDTPMVVVVSDSMAPKINTGDLLFLQGRDPEDIEVGDVVVYDAPWAGAPDEPIVHRVVGIRYNEEKDRYEFRTKGDANDYKDEEWFPEQRIRGVVIGRIPYIGWVKIVLTDYGLFLPILIILSVPLIISIIWDIIKGEEEKEKEEKMEKTDFLEEEIKIKDERKQIKKVDRVESRDDDFDF
ncbi:MAG: signal peptidase I [Promethearchaeota archaeon]|nr:MAG: signal peptidase I [Candidatus Lokiarchaeota archaeon]